MAVTVHTHETTTSLAQTDLGEFYAGTDLALQVQVSCASGCDLRGAIVKIVASDASVLKEVELTACDEVGGQTDEFDIPLPALPGEYTWSAVFPAQAVDGELHQESAMPFSFAVKPHAISMTVWDIPSPLVQGTDFRLKVGAKCSAGCILAGAVVEIYDHEGTEVGAGALGGVPYSESTDLYWTHVTLTSPATTGTFSWEARLPKPDLELPHEGTSFRFGFSSAGRPEHFVTIEVVDQDTKAPVANAHVMMRPYSGHTDDKGMVQLQAARGEYRLYVTKGEYDTFRTTVNVTGDAIVRAEMAPARFVEDYRGNLWKVERKT